jgi:di/tricarboxylate transporter
MTYAEKRTLMVFCIVVLLWVTGSWTRINPTIACLTGAILLMIPKLGVLNWKEAEKGVSWQIVMITGGGIALGDILTQTGAAKWIADAIFLALGLGGLSVVMLLIVVLVIIQYMHLFFVGTTVMATALMPIALGIAESAGLPPLLIGMPVGMIIGGYPLLMFYGTLPNIMVYDTGKISVMDFPRVGFIISGLACLVYAICAGTYWKWLGMY